ncbi:MAG TPA: MotA/TolQ/ExbB proton channel family protein [Rhodospirillales bacterium]|jgi:biopolymer transport protein ExbB/TolQ|nr:MotA/TolQ/ExbB proton channel family protein [Rhodospirillales bacterium]HIC72669.1 MotA/TolQ/ExbB proton channel family protein [Alphaproteobacteria bacterium]|tara:strand:- start:107 stop:862 length:756 start_codon:yes stop_codon:yes gene_type:complete
MPNVYKNLLVLVLAIIAIHLTYIGFIRPQAELAIETARQAGQSAPRDLFVILKDVEQEICLILMIWGTFLIADKCIHILKERYLFDIDLLESSAADKSGLTTSLEEMEKLPERVKESPLVQTLMASLRRYLITNDVQNTSDAITASVEALGVRLEAENSMVRYLIWAIPSIGFIGTVRGIGQALSQADKALAGDIAGMTDSLGVAFNSTFVALVISIGLMFLLHQLQRLQDGLLVDTQEYCDKFLLNRISS